MTASASPRTRCSWARTFVPADGCTSGAFFQGVGCTGQGRQFFIFDIDELLSLFQDFRRFRSHQGDGVAQEVRRRADGDERIPIGLQMADFDGTGDIVCRQDADDTGQGLGLFRMDGLDDSPRISVADGTAVTHAGQVDGVQIICISADAQDFGLDVDALAGIADAAVAAADGKGWSVRGKSSAIAMASMIFL